MNVEFVRFKASDDVELQGWLAEADGDIAVVHVHGMSGNGFENYFLDNLQKAYLDKSVTVFTFNNRGSGVVDAFRQGDGTKLGGSCFEIFEESAADIEGAINFLKSRGTKFILQGHSLGCTKVVNYILNSNDAAVEKVILLAPTDMTGWAEKDDHHEEYLNRAKQMLSEGKGRELAGAQCWIDKTPISAQTYPTICEQGSNADIYGNRQNGPLLGQVSQPTLIVYGDKDIGVTEVYKNIDEWQGRVNEIKNSNTQISIIPGAEHSFRNYEDKVAEAVVRFINT